jgi:dolichyl-phosphate-mannose-protein mannosyltransferase
LLVRRFCLLITIALALCMLFGMAAGGEENLFYNLAFSEDTNGFIDAWELSGGAVLSTYEDDEFGTVARLSTGSMSSASLTQYVFAQGDANYGIRFRARIVSGSGTVRVEMADYPAARSQVVTAEGWTIVDFYGKTSPEQQSLSVAFVVESGGGACTAEIALMECVRTDLIPSGATYVWLYDRQAWEQQQAPAENVNKIRGFTPLLLISLVYAVVALIVSRMRKREGERENKWTVRLLLLVCFAISAALSFTYTGHSTDIHNFSAWAQQLGNVGIPDFYTSGIWADYPPGYMYILYLCGLLGRLFGVAPGHALFTFIIKLPALLADIGCAYVVYRMARPRFGQRVSLWLCALFALNPMTLLDSAIWGQMDSVLTLALIGALLLYLRGQKPACAALLVLGMLLKPQMLVFFPLIFVAYMWDILKAPKEGLRSLGLSLLAGFATLVAVVLPFSKGQGALWIVDLYLSAANLYRYATVNAFNLYALLGMNWARDDAQVAFGLSAAQVGVLGIVAACALVGVLYVRAKNKRALFALCGLVMWGVFAFSHSMHERYLYPSILLFMLAYADTADRRYLHCAVLATATTFLNAGVVLWNASSLLIGTPFTVVFISVLNLAGFAYACYAQLRSGAPLRIDKPTAQERGDRPPGDTPLTLSRAQREGERMLRLDYLLMGGITLCYAAVALARLGSTQVPESFWRPLEREESVLVRFERSVDIAACYYYPGVGLGRVELSPSEDGTGFSQATQLNIGGFDMYSWQTATFETRASAVRITALDAKVLINEMAFLDAAGKIIPVAEVSALGANSADPTALFDEQGLVDLSPDFMTEMYFDEVYHARTAFEHLHGYAPYENTHPPLGKVFIMLGIWLFGMNPFGWRIVGTLFGIFMLPLLYVFAKRLFRDTRCAAVACFLFTTDGMHFAQTRIATIDVYGVFFIMAMCYFMYRYFQMNFFVDKLGATFIPLGLSGVMFGIGTASKWIGMYGGVGLAVAFFYTLALRYREYRRAQLRLPFAQGDEAALCRRVTQSFWQYTVATLLFCAVFFILVPLAIYLLSYLPYLLCAEKPYTLKGVWDIQTYMFNYHNDLTATHPFQSPWYSWPLVMRPIYYFAGSGLPEGTMQAIASFGNPIVWWAGFAAAFIVPVLVFTKRLDARMRSAYLYLYISLGAAFLPWALITRAAFIYHYFASVPFIILLTASLVRIRPARGLPVWAWALCAASLMTFCLFYPVWSGLPIERAFALRFMKWMPSWWFFT